MRIEYRQLSCVVALAAGLVLAACGDVQSGSGTLEVASVPTAEVVIDGTPHGSTPATVTLDAGKHDVVLKRSSFESHATSIDLASGEAAQVDAVLVGTDPADPEVIRALAEAFEIDYEPFEAPKVHRGSKDSAPDVVLLWPQKDVREGGLRTFALEVSLDYMGDGYLYFKKGRRVLHRSAFEPERVTTVATLPMVVREAVKKGDKVTWGIEFEDRRKSFKAQFKVVTSPKTDKAVTKLEKRKSFKAQPPLTQSLMRAQVLQSHRLYTEALLAHLGVVQKFPDSTQPYQGIVQALRRMDGDESQLWALASQFVSGKGPNRGAAKNPLQRPSKGGAETPSFNPNVPTLVDPSKVPLHHYNPDPEQALGAGDALQPDTTTEPPATSDTPDSAGDLGSGAAIRAGELARQADDLERIAVQIQEDAQGFRQEADQAVRDGELAQLRIDEAGVIMKNAEQALGEARQAYDDAVADSDPALTAEQKAANIEQAAKVVEDAEKLAEEAKSQLDTEVRQAAKIFGKIDKLVKQALAAEQQATDLADAARAAREHATAAQTGVQPDTAKKPPTKPEVPYDPTKLHPADPNEPREGAALDQLRRAITAAQVSVNDAHHGLAEAEAQLALNPSDPALQAAVAEWQTQLETAEGAVAAAEEIYRETGGQHVPEAPTALPSGPASEVTITRLRQEVEDAAAGMPAAEQALQDAQNALAGDPTNTALQQALITAHQAVDAARAAVEAADLALQAALESRD